MKILVAGGAGFIGSVLVPRLCEEGHEVAVVDLLWFGNHLPAEVEVLSRELFDLTEEDINGYDEEFQGWGCEDDDLRLRLRKAGKKIRSIMNITLSVDHRIVDGTVAATFVSGVKSKLEDVELWKTLT